MILHAAKDLGALIRDQRSRLGLTQEDLAVKVGVSRAWVVAIEKGKRFARVDHVFRTLKELDLTLRAEADTRADTSFGIDHDELADRSARNSKA